MSQKKSIAMILAFTALVLLSYQNCGVEAPQSMYDAFQVYKLPYEAKINQIAYMSCSEQQNVPNPSDVFFTLRAGAYGSDAGLKLSQNFIDETDRDQMDEKALKLAEEFSSLNYRVQFSLREQNNLLNLYLNGSSSSQGIEAQDFDFVFGDLGSNAMSASLVSLVDGQYMSYWPAGGISLDAYMQGSLVFNSAETVAEETRTFLEREGLLTLGYAQPVDPALLLTRAAYTSEQDDDGDGRKDDADDDIVPSNEAYGMGFRLTFKKPLPTNWGYTGSPHVNLPKRVLASVVEYDLTNPSRAQTAAWQCPSTLQLRVVFPEHRTRTDPVASAPGRTLCPVAADPTLPEDVANFQIVRRSLPVSDWDINWARKCAVPKNYVRGSCYGITTTTPTNTRSPQYNFTSQCDPAVEPNVCPHFVSICLRP